MPPKTHEFVRLLAAAGWSQAEAARRLQITPGAVSQICNAKTQPRPSTLNLLKLILARRLADADPLEVLAVERRSCFARLHEVTQTKAAAQRERASVQTMLLLDLASLRLEAFLKWLERCEEVLKKEGKE